MSFNEKIRSMMTKNYQRFTREEKLQGVYFFMIVVSTIAIAIIPGDITIFAQSSSDTLSSLDGNISSTANINTPDLPDAETIFSTETANIASSVGSFIILIPNEAHEDWIDERHKLLTDHNSYFIPTNLVVHQGTEIVFLHADAPWDSPHPHTVEITDSDNGAVVYSSDELDYGNFSDTIANLSPGNYTVDTTEYNGKEGTIVVLPNDLPTGNTIAGGFYTPTNEVENNKDNDGNPHPGSLQYFRTEFENNGFDILSEYNFTYNQCDYCPGGYWIDNKTGDHTLLIFATEQPLPDALVKLAKLVKDNVYV